MSLINQMLQDLDKRQAGPEAVGHLPESVHAAPAKAMPSRRWFWIGVAAVGASVVATYLILVKAPAEPIVQASAQAMVPPPESAQVVSPTSVPAPETKVLPMPPQIAVPVAAAPVVAAEPARPMQPLRAATVKATGPVKAKEPAKAAPPATASVAPAKSAGNIEKLVRPQTAAERAEQSYRDGVALLNRGNAADGVARLKKALGEDSTHVGARQLLVRAALERGNFEEARQVLLEGMQQPGALRWASLLARLELERGDLALARRAVDFALPQGADNADFQALAGAVAQRQGRPGEAADFYRAALRLAPGDGRWWVGLGLALESEGHAAEAREAFRRARSTGNLNDDLAAFAERHSRDK